MWKQTKYFYYVCIRYIRIRGSIKSNLSPLVARASQRRETLTATDFAAMYKGARCITPRPSRPLIIVAIDSELLVRVIFDISQPPVSETVTPERQLDFCPPVPAPAPSRDE